MKQCIWCKRKEDETSFLRKAHTIPQKMGGIHICQNVCDRCNSYFGNHDQGLPPIETVIKETFNVARARFLAVDSNTGKNKALARFKSIYFKVDFVRHSFSIQPRYKFHRHFQENICRQLKGGLYKLFLEEIERQTGDGLNPKYDFIREFARYNLGDYPVLYFERQHGIFAMVKSWVENPELFLSKESQMLYLVDEPGFFEFEMIGHVFGIVTTRNWDTLFDNYIKSSTRTKESTFANWRFIRKFNDVDLTLSILDRS